MLNSLFKRESRFMQHFDDSLFVIEMIQLLRSGEDENEGEAKSADEVEKCRCQMKCLVEMFDVVHPTVTPGGAALLPKVTSGVNQMTEHQGIRDEGWNDKYSLENRTFRLLSLTISALSPIEV